MQHLMIDFEKVQPADLDCLDPDSVHVWLFLGTEQQETIPLRLCESLCRFGKKVHFVHVHNNAPTALDFYLSFYLGKIIDHDPAAIIGILSQDSGYDVLVEHVQQSLQAKHISRVSSLAELQQRSRDINAFLEPTKDANNSPFASLVQPAHKLAPMKTTMTTSQNNSSEQVVKNANNSELVDKYYPNILNAMSQKDAYHPRRRRNLVANIRRFVAQSEPELHSDSQTELAELIVVRLEENQLITAIDDGLLSYHFNQDGSDSGEN